MTDLSKELALAGEGGGRRDGGACFECRDFSWLACGALLGVLVVPVSGVVDRVLKQDPLSPVFQAQRVLVPQ